MRGMESLAQGHSPRSLALDARPWNKSELLATAASDFCCSD